MISFKYQGRCLSCGCDQSKQEEQAIQDQITRFPKLYGPGEFASELPDRGGVSYYPAFTVECVIRSSFQAGIKFAEKKETLVDYREAQKQVSKPTDPPAQAIRDSYADPATNNDFIQADDADKAEESTSTTRITLISYEQYKNGLHFMRLNYPCSTKPDKRCEGCEADFDALLYNMEIEAPQQVTPEMVEAFEAAFDHSCEDRLAPYNTRTALDAALSAQRGGSE